MKLPPQNSMPDAGCGRRGRGVLRWRGCRRRRDFEFYVAVLVAYAVDGADEDSVGDGVGALGGLPGFVLGGAELFLFGGVPADSGGEEEGFCAFEGGDAGAFGVPLVPADESADFSGGGGDGFEAEVSGGEVELLVVEGVVGDVHLAVDVGDAAVFFDGDGGVVVEAGGAALEEAGDEDDAGLAADAGEDVGGGAGDGFSEAEEGVVLALAEVLGAEELWQADELGSLAGGFVDALGGLVEVELGVGGAGHLDESYASGAGVGHDFPGCYGVTDTDKGQLSAAMCIEDYIPEFGADALGRVAA